MGARSEAIARAARRPAAVALSTGGPPALLAGTTLVLVILGLIMILSASSVSSFATYGSSFLFFNKQLMWAVVGIGCFVVCTRLDYRKLRGTGLILTLGTIVLLIAVVVPGIGVAVGGSSRWLRAGPFSFQPSELAKLALILFAADAFTRKRALFDGWRATLMPMVPVLGTLCLLVMLQPDLGTTLLLVIIGGTLLFVAGAPGRHLFPLGLTAVFAAGIAAMAAPYRRARIFAFLDPWADPLNTGYQTIQSLIALGSGGWLGVGLGASRQKWMYVPNAHTDFIYAILGEEMGLLGTLTVLGMFGMIAYLGISTARRAPDRFGMLLASGITIWISSQALINIGAVTASLPITGVPLPLVSFGGSSLVVSLAAMGILTSISSRALPGKKAPGRTDGSVPAKGR